MIKSATDRAGGTVSRAYLVIGKWVGYTRVSALLWDEVQCEVRTAGHVAVVGPAILVYIVPYTRREALGFSATCKPGCV